MADRETTQNATLVEAYTSLAGENATRERMKKFHQDSMAEQDARIDEIIRAIREQLNAGKTTGDRVRDMVLQVHGYNPELCKKYSSLEAYLKGKKGELILLSAIVKVTSDKHGLGNWGVVTTRNVGYTHVEKLAGDKLKIGLDFKGQQTIILPFDPVSRGLPSQSRKGPKNLQAFQAFVEEINNTSPSLQELLTDDDWLGKTILVGTLAVNNRLAEVFKGNTSMAEIIESIEKLAEPF